MFICFQCDVEDVAPRATYVDGRGDREVGYTQDRVYDDRVVRVGWRDGDVLGGGGDIVRVSYTPMSTIITKETIYYLSA